MRWGRNRGRTVAYLLVATTTLTLVLLGFFGQHADNRTQPSPSPALPTPNPTPSPTSSTTSSLTPSQTPNRTAAPVGFSAPDLPYLDQAQLDAQLTGIRALGADWIRIDVSWPVVQPTTAASYDWSRYDRVVRAAATHSLKVVGVIDYTATWARLPVCDQHFQCQPRSPQLYADFAGAVARHFRDSAMTAMEIWNEPNVRQFWLPAPNAAFYTAMLTAADRAVKAVDPSLTVITGGLSPSATVSQISYSPLDFLDRLYGYGGRGSFDAVGYHPYSYPNLPSSFNAASAWSQLAATPRSLRSILTGHGDATVPIWLTEVGAPTGGPGASSTCEPKAFSTAHTVVSECLQAKLLTDVLCQADRTPDLGPTFVYTYQDRGTSTASIENFFGVLRADGTKKPSYSAVAAAIRHPCSED